MKKGFTLIELLAVIVILAIIALIATPIVLNIINDSKESATLRSAEFYIDGVSNAIMQENMRLGGTLNPNLCKVEEDGNVTCDDMTEPLEIEVDGEKPNGGNITFENGKIIDATLIFGENTTVTMNSKGELVLGGVLAACTYEDVDSSGTINISDVVTCGTESFYVMDNDGSNITMLTKYNLDVGNIFEYPVYVEECYEDDTGRYCNEFEADSFEPIENPTGIQNSKALGASGPNNGETVYAYGVVDMPNYYFDWDNYMFTVDANYAQEGRSHPYVYGDYSDNIYFKYVEAYVAHLKENKVGSASAKLMSYEQIVELGCANYRCSSAPSWVYSTSYWLGSAHEGLGYLWGIFRTGFLSEMGDAGDTYRSFGIRPVVTISISEVQQ